MSWLQRMFGSGGGSSGSDDMPQDTVPGPDDIVRSIEEGAYGNNAPMNGHGGNFQRSPAPSQRSPSFRPPTPPDDDVDESGDGDSPSQEEEDEDEADGSEREESLGTLVRNCHEELREAQDRAKVLEVERDIAQEDLHEMQDRERICPICERIHGDAATQNLCIFRHRRQLNRCRRRRGRREYPVSPDRGRSRRLEGHSPAPTSWGSSVSPVVSQTSGEESSEDELSGPVTVSSVNGIGSCNQSSSSVTRRRSSSSYGLVPSTTPPGRRRRRAHHVRAASTSGDGLVSSIASPGRRRRRLVHVAIPPWAAVPATKRLTRSMFKDGKGTFTSRLP